MRLAAEIHLAAGAMMALVGLPGLAGDRFEEGPGQDHRRRLGADRRPSDRVPPDGDGAHGTEGRGVVDTWGEHHDVRNLYVADGSIFPTCVAVNPQVSIMAFATRTAEHIAASR